jgi:hypothetical protein
MIKDLRNIRLEILEYLGKKFYKLCEQEIERLSRKLEQIPKYKEFKRLREKKIEELKLRQQRKKLERDWMAISILKFLLPSSFN